MQTLFPRLCLAHAYASTLDSQVISLRYIALSVAVKLGNEAVLGSGSIDRCHSHLVVVPHS